jgi:hypothetical protein
MICYTTFDLLMKMSGHTSSGGEDNGPMVNSLWLVQMNQPVTASELQDIRSRTLRITAGGGDEDLA